MIKVNLKSIDFLGLIVYKNKNVWFCEFNVFFLNVNFNSCGGF